MGVTGSQENKEKKPVALIVGGGYAGVQCAKSLDETGLFFVVLIDRKSYFLHNVATLRATVEENFSQKILIPYDRLLTNGCVVKAEVLSISHDGVQVHGRREPIHFDYLVIATGSSYAFPGKIAETEISKAISIYNTIREKVTASKNILIIGGGPVGIELAGEIATDFPDKEITLVHSQSTLLYPNVFKQKLYGSIQDQLEKLNVKIILNDRIQLPSDQQMNYIEGKNTYVTQTSKTSVTADLTFVCTGAHVNNRSLLNGSLKSKLNAQTGRLIVNNYLQVDGFENIFAVGDISDKETKLAYIAGEQGTYLGKLIPLLHKKKSTPKEYKVNPNAALLVSIGRNGGAGQLPFGGITIGSFLMKQIKSKELFTSRYRSMMNYGSDIQAETKSPYLNKLDSVQSILSLSEDDARNLLAGLPTKELEPGQDFS
ncbi:unnamed protein product [Rotaria magnacalcarata]|uniref:Ferroptosis suppressor protein 1 n=2 Tax=Rotaria magnacalcarata TaxID=392030 RepID=A0A816B364_9BILA|nr:unnamed protein product [Rotaria magnacalcarata]CAF1603602.1 unnamed protein product [Rotaria magnacalcarata]CAF2113043.1 unnamed protein product [Rotaria magnacalcarata]CAF2265678.1 unnamed protein product [Rotaria magnacalcarata]CAF3756293.1 unnamed protein product [Rotaria magnacalcarata]